MPELGLVLSRAQAKVLIKAWRRHCNEVQPHSRLGYLTFDASKVARKLKLSDSAPASGRDAAEMGSPLPGPLRPHPCQDKRKHREPSLLDPNMIRTIRACHEVGYRDNALSVEGKADRSEFDLVICAWKFSRSSNIRAAAAASAATLLL